MRYQFALALLLSVTAGVTYWYRTTSHICPVPITYRLGSIDESFSLTQAEAFEAIESATMVWERATAENLFEYDADADLVVSFIFDDRQATADARDSEGARLDAVQEQNQEIRDSIVVLQQKYKEMEDAFTERKTAYDQTLASYNEEVQQVNDRGGATEEEYESLQETQQLLQSESQVLRTMSDDLSSVATQLNQLSAEGNRLISSYNEDVHRYNDTFQGGEEFTQGDYTPGEIHVYKFSNQNELVSVLAHEFGHALGVNHVEEPESLMYYLLEEGETRAPELSQTDMDAYRTVCRDDSWEYQLRKLIRNVMQ